MDVDGHRGNGFLFRHHDSQGLFWAIKEAMGFYNLPKEVKKREIERVMIQSAFEFSHHTTAQQYIDLYEKMLQRPLVNFLNADASGMRTKSDKKSHKATNRTQSKRHRVVADELEEGNIIRLSARTSESLFY